ncbi:MAG: hypothetical protein PHS49_05315 [Candidatus Gracilibacteria bacterium]|nr:hypothetical protein [Candidatus Gracilibacteria bacterium]
MKKEDNKQIDELKSILVDFINIQTKFNEEQKQFNEEQKQFNEKIDKKIDKVQYFLEETIAENTKIFFDEQIQIKTHVRVLEKDISNLKQDVLELSSQVRVLQRA